MAWYEVYPRKYFMHTWEECVSCCSWVERSVYVRCSWFIVWVLYFFIFCLILSIIIKGVLKFWSIIVKLSISPSILSVLLHISLISYSLGKKCLQFIYLYRFIVHILFCSIQTFIKILVCCYLFNLKSLLSDLSKATPALFWLLFACNIFSHPLFLFFFHPFNLFVSLHLKCVSCRQLIVESGVFMHSPNCVLTEELNSFILNYLKWGTHVNLPLFYMPDSFFCYSLLALWS